MKLIDKDALVAEIKKRIDELWDLLPNASDVVNDNYTKEEANITGKYTALESFSEFIDTLEAKEVDLEKEIELWMKFNVDTNGFFNTLEFAKHCFELGLESAQNCNNSKCEDLRDDGICNFASAKLGRTMRCEKIACSRRNKERKGE